MPKPHADAISVASSLALDHSFQTSFFLWNGFSSGQSGITSARLWRLERGFGTDRDYKRTSREKKNHFNKNIQTLTILITIRRYVYTQRTTR